MSAERTVLCCPSQSVFTVSMYCTPPSSPSYRVPLFNRPSHSRVSRCRTLPHTIVSPGNLQRQSYNLGSQRALYMFPTRRSSTRGLNQVYGRADCGTPGTTMTCALASRQPSDSCPAPLPLARGRPMAYNCARSQLVGPPRVVLEVWPTSKPKLLLCERILRACGIFRFHMSML